MSDFFPAGPRKLPQRSGRSPAVAGSAPGPPVLPVVLLASAITVLLLAAAGFVFSGAWMPGTAGLALAAAAQAAAAACAAGTAAWAVRLRDRARLAALRSAGARTDSQVEVIINLARRIQSLLHREIGEIDDIERQTEDPDLLKRLFSVDHLATRMRRYTESVAVLGGAAARRRWSSPVPLDHVLRAAIAEIEHYARVTIVPPVPGIVPPSAVADVIHLVAELVENAAKFSPPATQVMIRVGEVAAGLAIDVEDRGLGMDPADRARANQILAGPADVGIGELLADGRIGMFVVSALARRHGITAELQRNVFGGTQAVIVLPSWLDSAGSPAAGTSGPAIEGSAAGRRLPQRVTRPVAGTGIDIAAPATGHPPSAGLPLPSPPPLPRRGDGPHMAPPLRGGRAAPAGGPAREAGHDPGLAANFLNGVRRGETAGGAAEPPGGHAGHHGAS